MAIKCPKKIEELFFSKQKRVQKILDANIPIADSLYLNHLRRQKNSQIYLDELNEVSLIFDSKNKIILVNINEFEKELLAADASNIEFDGLFCKLALLENFNSPPIWALYLAPDSVI